MINTIPYKAKQIFIALLKVSIIISALAFIYIKLFKNNSLSFTSFSTYILDHNVFELKHVCILITLSIFNWYFEVIKWKTLANTVVNTTFKTALEQTLGSLTASLITPNRIGDYGAKALYFSKPNRKKIVILNLIANTAQMLVTTFFGGIGLFCLVFTINTQHSSLTSIITKALITLIITTLILVAVLNKRLALKFNFLKKLKRFVFSLSKKTYIVTVVYSTLRYLLFSFQYYYLLTLFGADLTYINAMVIICSMYFLASILPSIALFDVVVKTGVAVYLFALIGINELTVLCTSTLMWLLNLILPSCFGIFYVLKFAPKTNT